MASRTVEVIAAGPPSADPYHPTAPAWALAGALAARGHAVRVLHPAGGAEAGPAPEGTTGVPLPLRLRRPGAALESADWAKLAGAHLRKDAELVVRDPAGIGRLGLTGPNGRRPSLAAFVRSVELSLFERERTAHAPRGVVDRVETWRDRLVIRRRESEALAEADRLFVDAPEVRDLLKKEYGIVERRITPCVAPVPALPDPPKRDAARGTLGVPLDVPVVAALAASDGAGPAGVDRVREAFRRIRPLFPGVRLVVAGAACPTDPGAVGVPRRDAATFATALAAADVAVLAPTTPGFDPGVVLALRAGVAPLASPEVRLPGDPSTSVRRVGSDDPGDFASALAELVADPELRHTLTTAGGTYVAPFEPAAVAAEVETVAPVGRR